MVVRWRTHAPRETVQADYAEILAAAEAQGVSDWLPDVRGRTTWAGVKTRAGPCSGWAWRCASLPSGFQPRGQNSTTPMPTKQIIPPIMSNRSGRKPSKYHAQAMDMTMNTPPYTA